MKDNIAVVCSGLCLLHCILLPVLLTLGMTGVLTAMMAAEWFHIIVLIPVIGVALASLPMSYFKHGSVIPVAFAGVGISGLISSLFLAEVYELWLTIPSALLVIWAHLWNRWLLIQYNMKWTVQTDG